MLHGFSGGMGTGKTLNAVKFIIENDNFAGRPVYYHGIRCVLFDYEVCDSFQGFLYGEYWLENLNNKALQKKLEQIDDEGRLAELDDFPYLAAKYAQHEPMALWLKWFKKLASPKRLEVYSEALTILGKDESDLTYDDIKEMNLSWMQFDNHLKIHELPAGSVILADEVQNLFPIRPSAAKVPPHIEFVATHRHSGQDLVYISQDFKDVDQFIRRRIQSYTHIEFFGRDFINRYQHNKLFNPESKSDLKKVGSETVKRDGKYHGVYLSSIKHTHNVKFNPLLKKLLFKLLLAVGVIALCIYLILFHTMIGKSFIDQDPKANDEPATQNAAPTQSNRYTKTEQIHVAGSDVDYLSNFIPRSEFLPFSSPIYDSLTAQALDYPELTCVATAKSCKCFTQQNTVYAVENQSCQTIARYGFFDPFHSPERERSQSRSGNNSELNQGGLHR